MQKKSSGFTLVEILITLTIFSSMALLISQSMQYAIKTQKKIQEQMDIQSRLLNALQVLEEDLHQTFYYRDKHHFAWNNVKTKMLKTYSLRKKTLKTSSLKKKIPSLLENYGTSLKRESPHTPFIGKEQEMHFTSLHHQRVQTDVQEAEFIEVSYMIRSCRDPQSNENYSLCLWRRSSPLADKKPEEGGQSLVLLENLKTFKLGYLGETTLDWSAEWNSERTDDSRYHNQFPFLVSVEMEMEGTVRGKLKVFKNKRIIPLRFARYFLEKKEKKRP